MADDPSYVAAKCDRKFGFICETCNSTPPPAPRFRKNTNFRLSGAQAAKAAYGHPERALGLGGREAVLGRRQEVLSGSGR